MNKNLITLCLVLSMPLAACTEDGSPPDVADDPAGELGPGQCMTGTDPLVEQTLVTVYYEGEFFGDILPQSSCRDRDLAVYARTGQNDTSFRAWYLKCLDTAPVLGEDGEQLPGMWLWAQLPVPRDRIIDGTICLGGGPLPCEDILIEAGIDAIYLYSTTYN